ncbi:MarR family transcriptional regulator [Cetobacterium sp. 2A]|uniref:MarR family winged helix-turn-helix transcriptional regulator n=1 Tax=Cetobacterium sp. 2A TaxID=2754723 RepID=UPI00163BDCFA|nr:MarR family transcriptional regulator [Cetobacterium sp. 2A]MBC2857122.1 MarR family transcriptional regulator [Cetobacterium sp. 2A]
MSKESIREQLIKLNRLYKKGNDRYYETALKLGISNSALMIFYGLYYAGRSCTQKELCDTWHLKKQTLHSALNQLIKSGDVYTESLSKNSRIKSIVLTEKGRDLYEKSTVSFLQAEERAFERLTLEERNMLLELTTKHTSYIQEESEALMLKDEIIRRK